MIETTTTPEKDSAAIKSELSDASLGQYSELSAEEISRARSAIEALGVDPKSTNLETERTSQKDLSEDVLKPAVMPGNLKKSAEVTEPLIPLGEPAKGSHLSATIEKSGDIYGTLKGRSAYDAANALLEMTGNSEDSDKSAE